MDYPADLQLAEFPGPEIKERLHWFRWFVFLRRSARDELQTLRNHVCSGILDQQVSVIRRDPIVQHAKAEALLSLEHPM